MARARFDEPPRGKSRRNVSLSPMVVGALRRRKVRQNEDRPALGATCDDLGLCFTVFDGNPLRPGNFRRDVHHPLIKKAGVPMIRFHDLRHSHATLRLSAGVHPKVVSERLGHSGIGMVFDTYSHVMPNLQREAADTLERKLFGAGG